MHLLDSIVIFGCGKDDGEVFSFLGKLLDGFDHLCDQNHPFFEASDVHHPSKTVKLLRTFQVFEGFR